MFDKIPHVRSIATPFDNIYDSFVRRRSGESWGIPGKTYTSSGPKTLNLPKPKVKVKSPLEGFAGSGSPLGTSFGINPQTKGQTINAALTVVGMPGLGRAASGVANSIGKRVFSSTYDEAAKGLAKAKAGGKIYTAGTSQGPRIASTRVMSPRQSSAAVRNLGRKAENISGIAGRSAANAVYSGIRTAGITARGAGMIGSQRFGRR